MRLFFFRTLPMLIACVSTQASAQMQFNFGPGAVTNIVGQRVLSQIALKKAYAQDPRLHRAPTSPAAASAFTQADQSVGDDPRISAQVKEAFLSDLRQRNPAIAAQMEASFNRRDVRLQFNEAIAPYGLHSDNAIDVVAAYLTAMWMAANQAPLPSTSQVQGVSRQLRDEMSAQSRPSSPAERQRNAEVLMYETVWLIDLRQQAQRQNNRLALQQLADTVEQKFRAGNVELRALRLTDAGLISIR